jgi:hypothetical protein
VEEYPIMAALTLEPTPVLLALLDKGVPALRRIQVEETDERVVLAGTVPTFYLKQLAQEAVLPLLAGRRLHNHLEVVRV